MSHPNPSHDRENEYPSDRSGFPKKKKTTLKSLTSLMHTKHFGAKHGARHKAAKSKALKKAKGESTDPF